MSYFDDASLVMIPSGYKTSKVYSVKPTDGSGDLTFSRSNDTATRVGPDGLIEKVRTNLYPRGSALLATGWTSVGATLTAGQTDPNGGTTALRVQLAAAQTPYAYIFQGFTGSAATYARSAYIKAASAQSIRIADPYSGNPTTVNLTTEWQRFTAVGAGVAPNFGIQFDNNNDAAAKDFTIAFVQIEEGDIATDYIATTSAAVSVGPVANVPRLDYLNSSCPRLLLEPQRQNISGFIESGTGNYSNATVTNPTNPLSILGLRSFRVTSNYSSGDAPHISNATEYQSGTTYTASAYFDLSQTNATNVELAMFGFGSPNGSASASLNVSTKAVTTTATSGAWSAQSGKATLISGSIYRLEITATAAQTFSGSRLYCAAAADAKYVEVAGIQIEAGAYATSFISKPTTAAVTRGADAASKTGISSLIGQSEGVVFVDFEVTDPAAFQPINIYNNNKAGNTISTVTVEFNVNTVVASFFFGNGTFDTITLTGGGYGLNQRLKVAFRYKSGELALYVNGVQKDTDSATYTANGTKSEIFLGDPTVYFAYKGGFKLYDFLQFPTSLTNAQLAELTTI